MTRVPLSASGLQEAQAQVRRFADDLLGEASAVARRSEAEEASRSHVRLAATHLYASGRSHRGQILLSLGGLVAGGAASALATLVATRPLHLAGLVVSVGVLVAGSVMLTLGAASR